ncbi:MAG: hypothetical protein AAB790_03060 [Patescibacteria group bacterium]
MKALTTSAAVVLVAALFIPVIALANHKAEVGGKILIDSNDPGIRGTDNGCNAIHYHGTLDGVADPDSDGCGHGLVTVIPHGDGDGETIPAPLPKGPSFPARVWTWLGSWFTSGQKEAAVNVIDVVAESNGIAPPGTVSDTVDIVRDAAPSIKANADNADAYFDTYEDAPDRDRYTLENENPEENAPVPSLYRWFWGLFE